MTNVRELRFQVLPAPESNDHQVRIWIDGNDFLAKYAPDMLGMDPEDLLDHSVLDPRKEPHEEIIARCSCGVVSCGDATVTISVDGDNVIWDSWDGGLASWNPGKLIFTKEEYLDAVNTALTDHTWETADRTAARILKLSVNRDALSTHQLKYQWASGRIKKGELTISMEGPSDYYQILLHVPWHRESPQEIAEKAAEMLATNPGQWRKVTWYSSNTKPPFDGSGWRK